MKYLLFISSALLVGLIALAIPTAPARTLSADLTPTPGAELAAEVETVDGATTRFSGPSVSGKWEVGSLTFSDLICSHIQQFERTGEGVFVITTTDGTRLEAVPSSDVSFWGKGEWGDETIPFLNIQRITLHGSTLPPAPTPEDTVVQIETTDGMTFRLVAPSASEALHMGDFSFTPAFAYLQHLERTGSQVFAAQAVDGTSAEITVGDAAHLSGRTDWARFATVPLTAVQRLTLQSAPSPAASGPAELVIEVETASGQIIRLAGHFGSVTSSGELKVEADEWQSLPVSSFVFSAVHEIRRTAGHTFTVNTVDGTTTDVIAGMDASLGGPSLWGKGRFSFSAIQRITVLEAPSFPPDALAGELELTSGSIWGVRSPSIHMEERTSRRGEVNDRLWNMLLLADPVEYWLDDRYVFDRGFSQENGEFVITCEFDWCPAGAVDDENATLRFTFGGMVLEAPLAQVQRYTPAVALSAPMPGPIWSVAITGWNGQRVVFPFTNLAYLRYPATCWSGWYSSDPFRWYTDDVLPVIKPDGSQLDIDFTRLARIEFSQPYDARRAATVFSTQGSSLQVTIYPGSTNEDTKKGPASWSPDQEGLLGTVAKGVQVFIPLPQAKAVELNPPGTP